MLTSVWVLILKIRPNGARCRIAATRSGQNRSRIGTLHPDKMQEAKDAGAEHVGPG